MAKRWILLHAVTFLAPMSYAESGGPLTAYGPARLSGLTDGKTPVALMTLLNLRSTAAIESLVLDPAPLKGDNGVILDRGNVKLTSPPVKFGAGELLPVGITVSGLVRPGTYTGGAVFRDAKAAVSVRFDIEATLVGKPVLKVATDGLSALTCVLKWSCEAGERWLGGRKVINLTNEGAGPAEIGDAHVVLRATRGVKVLDDVTLRPEASPKSLLFSGTIGLNVPNDLPADRYQGILRVDVKNADEAAPTPVTLDVRHGPWVALLVLAAGILIGRKIQSTQGPEAQARQRLMATLAGLQAAERGIRDAAVATLIGQKLEDERQKIAGLIQAASETQIAAALTNLSATIDLAKNLERLDAEVTGLDEATKQQAQQHIGAARSLLLADNLTDAEKERAAAQGLVFGAAGKTEEGRPPALHLKFIGAPREMRRPIRLRALQTFAGSEKTGEDVKDAYMKPFLFGLLFIGLLIVGLYTLYVKNSTFGADIVYDYFSLLVWGLSADVAQRTLQNLQK